MSERALQGASSQSSVRGSKRDELVWPGLASVVHGKEDGLDLDRAPVVCLT